MRSPWPSPATCTSRRTSPGCSTSPRGALGPIAATLREADVAMLNLESAITERGRRDPKELEDAGQPLPLPDVAACAGRPRGCRRRRGQRRQQPRRRLRPGRPARHPRGGPRRGGRGDRRRPRRDRGLHAVPRDRGRDRPGLPGRRLGLPGGQQRRVGGRPRHRRRGGRARGRPGALLEAVRAGRRGRRRGGRLPPLGPRAPVLPHPEAAPPRRASSPRPAPTSWWGATPTSWAARAGRGTPTWATAWPTSSGTTTGSPRPASCRCAWTATASSTTPGPRPGSPPADVRDRCPAPPGVPR